MQELENHAWVKDTFQGQYRPVGFHATESIKLYFVFQYIVQQYMLYNQYIDIDL